MPEGTCSVATCERRVSTRGLCISHYERERGTVCSVAGCERFVRARGWCSTHHQRWRMTGSVEDPVQAPSACTFAGCGRPHNSNGLCYQHRTQQRKGTPLRPLAAYRWRTDGGLCDIPDCTRPRTTKGLCGTHARRVRLHGDPHSSGRPAAEERFWRFVEKTETCWLWTGHLTERNYGTFVKDGRNTGAYRAAWELLIGPVAPGLELDHLCRNPRCVNPDHLQPVTHAENMRRSGPYRAGARKTHCSQGHPFSGDNLHLRKNGHRECRTCIRTRSRAQRAKRKQQG